jgi:transcriptional regulator of acetoin/glycerol metabolism
MEITMNKQNVTLKKAMIEALEQSLGVVTTACKIVGISRNTHYFRSGKTYNILLFIIF